MITPIWESLPESENRERALDTCFWKTLLLLCVFAHGL